MPHTYFSYFLSAAVAAVFFFAGAEAKDAAKAHFQKSAELDLAEEAVLQLAFVSTDACDQE